MKITKRQTTIELPEVIEECSGCVSMVFEDGTIVPINKRNNMLKMFRKFWLCPDVDSVELIFENTSDIKKILYITSAI